MNRRSEPSQQPGLSISRQVEINRVCSAFEDQWRAAVQPEDLRRFTATIRFRFGTTSNARIYYINFLEGQPQLSYLRREQGRSCRWIRKHQDPTGGNGERGESLTPLPLFPPVSRSC